MKGDTKTDKNAQISAILYVFYALKAQKVVKSQRDFAAKAGVHEQSLSAALRGSDQYLTPKFMEKIEALAKEYGIDINPPLSFVIQEVGDGAHIGEGAHVNNTENSENVKRLLSMLDERDAQINRLLTLLENEQKARGLCQ